MLRRTEGNEDGKNFSRSIYELRWRSRNDSLAVDSMKVASHIAANAISAAGERPLEPDWRSMANGDGMSRWHLTSRCTSEKKERHCPQDRQEGGRDNQKGRSRNRRTIRPEGTPANGMRHHRRAERMRALAAIPERVPAYGADRCTHVVPDEAYCLPRTRRDRRARGASSRCRSRGRRRRSAQGGRASRSAPLSLGKRRECGRATDSDANRPEATCRRCGTRFE